MVSQVYKFIEANRSLEKLISQDLEYPIKTAYNLIKAKKSLDEAIEYVMERFGIVCGNEVDFENISDEQNAILNTILSQDIEIELPDINTDEIMLNEKVTATPSDIENILFLFGNDCFSNNKEVPK